MSIDKSIDTLDKDSTISVSFLKTHQIEQLIVTTEKMFCFYSAHRRFQLFFVFARKSLAVGTHRRVNCQMSFSLCNQFLKQFELLAVLPLVSATLCVQIALKQPRYAG